MGIIPLLLQSPTVGFMPTIPFIAEGQSMEPSVSVPMAMAHKLADTAVPEPELDPQGFLSIT
jgi:hypothetical protein